MKILTIFGASGDLAKLKIYPAIYELMLNNFLPDEFRLIGFSRTNYSREEFQKLVSESITSANKENLDNDTLQDLIAHTYYISGNYDDLGSYENYQRVLESEITNGESYTNVAYLSVPPVVFKDVIKNIALTKSTTSETKVVVEKPFGTNEKTAEELFHHIETYFRDEDIFLLDHYFGKRQVQDILNLRFSNRIFSSMLKGSVISNIQLSILEKLGVENRTGYYDQVGTIKDMTQSHLLQMLALLTMDTPIYKTHESISREKYNILSALKFTPDTRNISLGQYRGYKEHGGVSKDSKTDTFSAINISIDRQEWYKVPIYVRTGKMLDQKATYIVVELKKYPFQNENEKPNKFILELQPEVKVKIQIQNSIGGEKYEELTLTSNVACSSVYTCMSEHAQLICEVFRGDKTNFLTFPEILASWRFTDSISRFIEENHLVPEIYEGGSGGPQTAEDVTRADGLTWN